MASAECSSCSTHARVVILSKKIRVGDGDGLLHCSACGVLNPWKFVAQRLRARQRASNGVHALLIYFDSVTDDVLRWAGVLFPESELVRPYRCI